MLRATKLLALSVLLLPLAYSQPSQPPSVIQVPTDPSGVCNVRTAMRYNYVLGTLWGCKNGTWTLAQGAASGGTAAYGPITITAQTSVSVSAATHGQGTSPIPYCFDNASPKVQFACDPTIDSSGNIVLRFNPAFTGVYYVGSVGGIGPTGATGATGAGCSVLGGVLTGTCASAGFAASPTFTGTVTIGATVLDGSNGLFDGTLGSELAPALTAGNWTVGSGWESPIVGPGLIKNANGTGTQTPSAATSIVAGTVYKVVITLSALSVGSATYTVGGMTGQTLAAATTYTDYITANTTGKLIITPTNTSRFTISAISIKALTVSTGQLVSAGRSSTQGLIIGAAIPTTRNLMAGLEVHGASPGLAVCNDIATLTEPKCTMWYQETNGNYNLNTVNSDGTNAQAYFQLTRSTGQFDTFIPLQVKDNLGIHGNNPFYVLTEDDGSANEKTWAMSMQGGVLNAFPINDASVAGLNWLTVSRIGNALNGIALSAGQLSTGTFSVTTGNTVNSFLDANGNQGWGTSTPNTWLSNSAVSGKTMQIYKTGGASRQVLYGDAAELHLVHASNSANNRDYAFITNTNDVTLNLLNDDGTVKRAIMVFNNSGLIVPTGAYATPNGDGTKIFLNGSSGTDQLSKSSGNYLNLISAGPLSLQSNTAILYLGGTSGMYAYGGLTSSFPAFKRSTTGLLARLADDTGDALLGAGTFRGAVVHFASLSTTNGDLQYCDDCTVTSGSDDTCAGSGTGATARRLNGVSRCTI